MTRSAVSSSKIIECPKGGECSTVLGNRRSSSSTDVDILFPFAAFGKLIPRLSIYRKGISAGVQELRGVSTSDRTGHLLHGGSDVIVRTVSASRKEGLNKSDAILVLKLHSVAPSRVTASETAHGFLPLLILSFCMTSIQ